MDLDNLVVEIGACRAADASARTTNLDPCHAERLAERTRIAQELHDTLLQGLFGVSLQLRAVVDSLSLDETEKFIRPLEAMDRVIEEGRRAVLGLRSSYEQYPSLGHAFAGVPGDLGFPSATGFRVVVEGRKRELRAPLCDEIYRIGREAIVNALRHAQANRIEAEIEYGPAELRIAVRDNGCGIDPRLLQRNGHWGLQGMRERAERIGAQLRILSKVALGTEVELCVPSRLAFERS